MGLAANSVACRHASGARGGSSCGGCRHDGPTRAHIRRLATHTFVLPHGPAEHLPALVATNWGRAPGATLTAAGANCNETEHPAACGSGLPPTWGYANFSSKFSLVSARFRDSAAVSDHPPVIGRLGIGQNGGNYVAS